MDVSFVIDRARQTYEGIIVEVPAFVGESAVLTRLDADILAFAADALEVLESGDENFRVG